jgi:ATP synthase protein I
MPVMNEPKYQQLGDLLTVGIMFPVCIGIGYGMGWLLDRWLGTQSVFKIVFLLFGIAAGFINLFKVVRKIDKSNAP